MPNISISTSHIDQLTAASQLSEILNELQCPHAYIGEKLSEYSKQFASAGLKFFYVKELQGCLSGDELVRTSKDNVLIETLQAGTLGLPCVPEPVCTVQVKPGININMLHPAVLILTKMKRWKVSCDSTRPQTRMKNQSDKADLEFLVYWLANHDMTIAFDKYKGKSKEELLDVVRVYRERICTNQELIKMLEKVVNAEDWKLIVGA
ncbi:hypothetical protein AMATHDRAFT_50499 [Amanita thiersii Skay4041]|uniref:Uncharacterized protein n=1 Tax=Amanita thiersii Skay4041 TaxID=703135 RepID=A0A2A9N9D9_9AGAR|nr:hypothetical protein AMATHDRAFT_50499 [Amanita thiersii Skay4041]